MKVFFGGKFIEKKKLENEGIYHPIKLEYYKRSDEIIEEKMQYGISIVKTEYIPEGTKIESKDIPNITEDEEKVEQLLSICKKYEVTPITLEDILQDLFFSNNGNGNFIYSFDKNL